MTKPYLSALIGLATLTLFPISSLNAADDIKHFDGLYLGTSLSSQNIFSGAFLDNVDVLTEDTQLVADVAIGWRKQFDNGFVLGGELQYGVFDGTLRRTEGAVRIEYDGNSQISYGLTLGWTLGATKKSMLFAYGFGTDRDFNITVTLPDRSFAQQDGQGFIRYGAGFETMLWKNLHARAMIGRLTVDFGDLVTNIPVDEKWDLSLGVTLQF